MVSQSSSRKPKKSPKRKIIVIAVVLLILIAGTAVSLELTSQSSFCNSCHEMEDYHSAWEDSSHSSVDCIECHSEPGLAGYIDVKLNGLHQVWLHVTDNVPDEIRADQQKINCISCHQDKPRTNTEQAKADKDPHSQIHFDDLSMTCSTCHLGLTHQDDLNDNRPSRESCLNCHPDGAYQ